MGVMIFRAFNWFTQTAPMHFRGSRNSTSTGEIARMILQMMIGAAQSEKLRAL